MQGMEVAARALAAAGAIRVVVPNAAELWDLHLAPHANEASRQAQLDGFISKMRAVGIRKYDVPLFSAHQMGSCRMGSNARSSVCDARGQCWEVCGLYVADASLFPTASGVNPMITVYALSYMVASGLAQHWRTEQQRIGYREQGGRPVAC
eukprot:GHRR01032263.1.p1 GENE.GHRR01032263.1~~GHRR01032263.1.p1  ORF type:complete len:151 (+),score=50.16 GHRR01032263.1:501-953(+)